MRGFWLLAGLAACGGADAPMTTADSEAPVTPTGAPVGPCPQETAASVPFLVTGDLAMAPDRHQATCAFEGGNDYSVAFTAPRTTDYLFSVGGSDPTDVVVALKDQCEGAEIDCDRTFQNATLRRSMTAGETVLVVAEGYSILGNGPFRLEIREAQSSEVACEDGFDDDGDGATDCADADCDGVMRCGPEICDDAFDNDGNGTLDCFDASCVTDPACCPLEATSGLGTYTATTVDRLNRFQPSCVGATGPEVTFGFTAPSAGTYTFDTAGSSFDTVLYALDECGGTELDCNDDDDDLGLQSRITLGLQAGEAIVIVVDGFNATGEVVLGVQ